MIRVEQANEQGGSAVTDSLAALDAQRALSEDQVRLSGQRASADRARLSANLAGLRQQRSDLTQLADGDDLCAGLDLDAISQHSLKSLLWRSFLRGFMIIREIDRHSSLYRAGIEGFFTGLSCAILSISIQIVIRISLFRFARCCLKEGGSTVECMSSLSGSVLSNFRSSLLFAALIGPHTRNNTVPFGIYYFEELAKSKDESTLCLYHGFSGLGLAWCLLSKSEQTGGICNTRIAIRSMVQKRLMVCIYCYCVGSCGIQFFDIPDFRIGPFLALIMVPNSILRTLKRCCDAGEPVLRGVSLRIEPGEFVTLVGPSGGGKTTLLKIMMGLIPPVYGQLTRRCCSSMRARHTLILNPSGW